MENAKFSVLTEKDLLDIDGGVDPIGLFGLMLALGYAVGKITKYYFG